ncbi:MAG: nicotinate-nucleotide diphosphorylase (carboxylating), partial [Bacteroidales bacterium]
MLQISEIVRHALQEDLGDGDHTSLATIPASATGKAHLLVKQHGILAGLPAALEVFRQVDSSLQVEVFISDGTAISPGDIIFEVSGSST